MFKKVFLVNSSCELFYFQIVMSRVCIFLDLLANAKLYFIWSVVKNGNSKIYVWLFISVIVLSIVSGS